MTTTLTSGVDRPTFDRLLDARLEQRLADLPAVVEAAVSRALTDLIVKAAAVHMPGIEVPDEIRFEVRASGTGQFREAPSVQEALRAHGAGRAMRLVFVYDQQQQREGLVAAEVARRVAAKQAEADALAPTN